MGRPPKKTVSETVTKKETMKEESLPTTLGIGTSTVSGMIVPNFFKFMCKILSYIYINDNKRKEFAERAISGEPLNEEETNVLKKEFIKYAKCILLYSDAKRMNEFSYLYYKNPKANEKTESIKTERSGKFSSFVDDIVSYRLKEEKEEKSKNTKETQSAIKSVDRLFKTIFVNKTGVQAETIFGIAYILALGIEQEENSSLNFFISGKTARKIFEECMAVLNPYANETDVSFSDFSVYLPDDFDYYENDPEHFANLFFLALFGTLYHYCPKKDLETQEGKIIHESRLCRIRNIIKNYIEKYSEGHSRLCEDLHKTVIIAQKFKVLLEFQLSKAERVELFGGKQIKISSFYKIPHLESLNRFYQKVFSADVGVPIRSMIIGKKGSGKKILSKAIVCSCLGDKKEYKSYIDDLEMTDKSFIPLIVDCKEISDFWEFAPDEYHKKDIIDWGFEPLIESFLKDRNTDENQKDLLRYKALIKDIYCQYANSMKLLIIIDDPSCLSGNQYDDLVKKLKSAVAKYPYLNILVITKPLESYEIINSIQDRYASFDIGYQYRNIEGLKDELDKAKLTDNTSIDLYIKMENENNPFVIEFTDCYERLMRFIGSDFDDFFIMDDLIAKIVEEYLPENDSKDVMTALAVYLVEENRFKTGNEAKRVIASNIIGKFNDENKKELNDIINGNITLGEQIWKNEKRKMNIVCISEKSVNAYKFTNRLFCCSLAADYYISIWSKNPGHSLMDNFNNMSAADFSTIAYMMISRISKNMDIRNYDKYQKLIQTIALGVLTVEDVAQTIDMLNGIKEIVNSSRIEKAFQSFKQLWSILKNLNDFLEYKKASFMGISVPIEKSNSTNGNSENKTGNSANGQLDVIKDAENQTKQADNTDKNADNQTEKTEKTEETELYDNINIDDLPLNMPT